MRRSALTTYTRLERGSLAGVSESVLDSLARALQLDEAERTRLFDLAHTANQRARSGPHPQRTSAPRGVRPGVLRLLDAISTPAYVRNGRMDILALKRGRRLVLELPGWSLPGRPARWTGLPLGGSGSTGKDRHCRAGPAAALHRWRGRGGPSHHRSPGRLVTRPSGGNTEMSPQGCLVLEPKIDSSAAIKQPPGGRAQHAPAGAPLRWPCSASSPSHSTRA